MRCIPLALLFSVGFARIVSGATTGGCGGDCGANRSVSVSDLLTMVNIALGDASLTVCEAGDVNRDGRITINEILAAVNNALNGCPPPVALQVGSAMGRPGQSVSFAVTISTLGKQIAATQNVIAFDPHAPIVATASGDPDCTSSTAAFVFLPPQCIPAQSCTAIRVTYFLDQIPDGAVLYTCNVAISPTASMGTFALQCTSATYVDENIDQFNADCTDGEIAVTAAAAR